MNVSIGGICSILAEEAIVLSTYDDGTGVLTIGAGHTAMAGVPSPTPGMKISLLEALNIFRRDVRKYEDEVANAVTVPLAQHQFDALVSWHYNTGSVRTATLTKKVNEGDFAGAAREFARWNKADGEVLAGLVKRRKRESAIFKNANYGDPFINVFDVKGGKAIRRSIDEILRLTSMESVSEEDQTTEQLLANPNSKLLPGFRPRQSEAVSNATVQKFLHLVPADRHEDAVKVLAVRGYYTNTLGEKGKNDRNLYDDAIFVIEPDGVHNFNGNTDPSRFRKGIAKLDAPQAVRYVPGPHGFKRIGGPYPAFRQDSECTVIRDQTGEDTGLFWINLHRGGNTNTSSAGCQTVPPHQWNEFKALVDNLLSKYDQKTFYYLLVDQPDVVSEASIVIPEPEPVVVDEKKKPEPVRSPATVGLVLLLLINLVRASRGKQPLRLPARDAAGQSAQLDDLIGQLSGGTAAVQEKAVEPEKQLTPINAALGEKIGNALNGRKTGLGIVGLLLAVILPELNPELAELAGMGNTGLTGDAAGQAGGVADQATNVVTTAPDAGAGGVTETGDTTAATDDATATPQSTDQNTAVPAGEAASGTEKTPATRNLWLPLSSALAAWGILGKLEKWVYMLKGRK